MEGQERNLRKVRMGEVVSDKNGENDCRRVLTKSKSTPFTKRQFTILKSLKYMMRRVRPA